MADIHSISRIIDDVRDEHDVIIHQPIVDEDLANDSKSANENGVIDTRDLNGGISTPSTVTVSIETEDEETLPTVRALRKVANVQQKVLLKKQRHSILKKSASTPALLKESLNEVGLNNPNQLRRPPRLDRRRSTFADVVQQVIRPPIEEDIHPFGRGHLYKTALEKDLPKIHNDEGKLLMWVIATLLIFGIAVAVIVMSEMYKQDVSRRWESSVTQSVNITGLNSTLP